MLSDVKLRALKPKEKNYKLLDTDGLYIEVTTKGRKFWRYRITYQHKEHMYSLGEYPYVLLGEARRLRDEKKAFVIGGCVEKKKSPTFREAAKLWVRLKEESSRAGERNKFIDRGRLDNHILPRIGDMTLDDITPNEIKQLARSLELDGKNETARRCIQVCRQVFDYAYSEDMTKNDPTSRLHKAVSSKEVKHMAAVRDPAGIGRLLRLIDGYGGYVTKYALQLQAYTFLRPFEIRYATWNEFELGDSIWRLPRERTKMKNFVHLVPLAKQAMEIIEKLRPLTSRFKHVFVSGNRDVPISENTLLHALLCLKNEDGTPAYKRGEITSHGFRSTASTRLHEEGWPSVAIELQLGHIEGNQVKAAYNYAEHLETRRVMMQWWADYLDSLRDGTPKPEKPKL